MTISKTPTADAERTVKRKLVLNPKRLAGKLVTIRCALDLSQNEMPKQLGAALASSDISKFELGRREPALGLLLNYARLANVELEVLVDDEVDLPAKLPSPTRHSGTKRVSASRKRKE